MYKRICMCLALMSMTFGFGEKIRIHVASLSPQKIGAARNAFEAAFPDDEIVISMRASGSGIPSQPYGKSAALRGAHNRVHAIAENGDQEADYIVAFENYIEQDEEGKWIDRAVVVLKSKDTARIALSKGTEIPEHYVVYSQRNSKEVSEEGWSYTVGKAIAESSETTIDPSDWHREAIFGGISRVDLLSEALFQAIHSDEIAFLKTHIALFRDFPKPGIMFEDFSPLLGNGNAFSLCIDMLAKRYQNQQIDAIVGLESRGFILGAALAKKLGVGFVPVRKAGKIPGPTYAVQYEKEYGYDTLTIAQHPFRDGARVLIIDDLIATGGSAKAAIELVKKAGGVPFEFASILEIAELNGRAKLDIRSFNLLPSH